MKTKEEILQEFEDIIVEEDLIDNYFPKGDNRRGEVLVILGVIYAKQKRILNKYFKGIKK